MNTKSLITGIFMLALSSAPLPSIAASKLELLGDPAPPEAATRTIVITPRTKYVNVEGGETIRFKVGENSFTWAFNGSPNVQLFNLNQVAPPGLLDHVVKAYVAVNPLYIGL